MYNIQTESNILKSMKSIQKKIVYTFFLQFMVGND